MQSQSDTPDTLDRKRFRKVRWFFAKVLIQTFFWDILLNRPMLRWLRTEPLPRWRIIARKFRALAVEMGGVLIKLGQFLSIRVDILPVEVTRELAGLQDEVPAEPTEAVIAQLEADFGCPLHAIFASFDPEPLGAASLAQAHHVRLADGTAAIVKVLRPGIDVLVRTDLAAIRLACKWLKLYKKLRNRVDLDWLADEFTTITLRELDFGQEGRNADRIAADFADDPRVYFPKVYWDYSAARTLTLENVGYIKIADLNGIEAAGISRRDVADTLYNLYMEQVFETYFVHVDPHPGNLFVRPLPCPEEAATGVDFKPGDPVTFCEERPFQIVFVDFGMMAETPERLRAAIREYAIGLGTQDAHRIVQSYVKAGTLLPGADLNRLEEVHRAMFERFWGVGVGKLRDTVMKEAEFFMEEYRDIIQEAPFQFQVDMLFILRAVGILSGMAANLDPNFDVWSKTLPYARKYAREALEKDFTERAREIFDYIKRTFQLPLRMASVLTIAERGRIEFQAGMAGDLRRAMMEIRNANHRTGWMVLCAGFTIAGSILYAFRPESGAWTFLALIAGFAFFRGSRS